MQLTRQLSTRKPMPRTDSRAYSWLFVVFIVGGSIATGLLVNFLDELHYSNLLLQANGQASAAQTALGKEEYDVKFLINNGSTQLNCFNLRSDYARRICNTHDNGNSTGQ
jgi:hypothetical protein